MEITLSPNRSDAALKLSKVGDVLTVNGAAYDLSVVLEGETLRQSAIDGGWLASNISRVNGILTVSVLLPHGPDAPQEVLFPTPIIDPPDGDIALPIAQIDFDLKSETTIGNIDLSKLVTAEHKASEVALALAKAVNAECDRRIWAFLNVRDKVDALAKQQSYSNWLKSMEIKESQAALATDELAKRAAILTGYDFILSLVAASDNLRALDEIPTDFTDAKYWP